MLPTGSSEVSYLLHQCPRAAKQLWVCSLSSITSVLALILQCFFDALVNTVLQKACHVPGPGLGIRNAKRFGHHCILKESTIWDRGQAINQKHNIEIGVCAGCWEAHRQDP